MAQPLERLLASGKQITDTGRTQALQLRTDLVEQGRLATDQISAVVDRLVNPIGRERIEDLRQTVRGEVQHELRMMRESLSEDLAKIESVVDRITGVVNETDTRRRGDVEELVEVVRDEVQRQLTALGLATRDDVAALGRSLRDDLAALEGRLEQRVGASSGGQDTVPRQAPVQVTPPHRQSPSY
jgi:polyhydroxyalkanoate synthesis regulator phasin